MSYLSSCSICNMFERLQLPLLGNIALILGSVLAIFSLVAWPLMFVWPVLFLTGLGLAAGYGACTECRIG